ncbi:MAG TPA: hypothetical protein VHU80_12510 [Polyangiaceae bacterium]|jgi:hypothetical protein|nr:hypothetical protein [Polyangiaceae bacterium]
MKTAAIVGEPELEADSVVVRVAVEDTVEVDSGGLFVCKMKDYGTVAVESFPPGQTTLSSGADRVEAGAAAMRYALDNSVQFDALFAELRQRD